MKTKSKLRSRFSVFMPLPQTPKYPGKTFQLFFIDIAPPEDPEGSPTSFLYPHNIQCKQVFRVFSGSTKVHIIKPKRRLKTIL